MDNSVSKAEGLAERVHCGLLMADLNTFKLNLAGTVDTLENNCDREQVIAQGYIWCWL